MRECIRTLCVLSVVSGVLVSLTPEGGARRILRLLSSVVLLAVIFNSLNALDLSDYGVELARYREREQELLQNGEELRDELNRLVIEQEYREYIEERAASLFAALESVEITVRWSSEGFWVPESSRICLRTKDARDELSRILESELGIPAQKQEWEIRDEGESALEEA